MNIEKLKALLESNAITQEEYDSMVESMGLNKDPEPTTTNEPTPTPEPTIDYDKLDRLMQARLDKAMAQERKEKAELKKQLETLRQSKLTDDELKQIEIEQKEQEIANREQAIKDKENRLFAIKTIREQGLDDGDDTSLALVDFVMGEDETAITNNVKAFKEIFDKKVAAEVDKRFKAGGGVPKKGTTLNNGVNPYLKEQYSLTEQMKIEINNPELAAQLKAAAGVK